MAKKKKRTPVKTWWDGMEELDKDQLKQESPELQRAIRAKEKEQDALEARLRDELLPEFKELIRYARRRGHAWLDMHLLFLAGPDKSDAERVEAFVEVTTASTVMNFEADEIGPLKNQLSKTRKKLRELKKYRDAMETVRQRSRADE